MTNRAIIGRVTEVIPHPTSPGLDVVAIGDYTNVANREADNLPRYQIGDYAVMLVPDLILPTWLLQHLDLWNAEKGKGRLGSSRGNRTKSRMIDGLLSDVALLKVDCAIMSEPFQQYPDYELQHIKLIIAGLATLYVKVTLLDNNYKPYTPDGIDVTEMLGIETYVGASLMAWKTGDAVRITHDDHTIAGTIKLASPNNVGIDAGV